MANALSKIARLDRIPFHEGVYFAFITAFTVGLGDITPKSHATRVITVVLAFFGLVLAGILVGIAVQALDTALNAA